jgi:hypothetical protein
MEVFRDLIIQCNPEQMAALVDRVEPLPEGWLRDRAAEARISAMHIRPNPTYCFTCPEAPGTRPAAMVILAEKEPGLYSVGNVVPAKRQLTHREYNAILAVSYTHLTLPTKA